VRPRGAPRQRRLLRPRARPSSPDTPASRQARPHTTIHAAKPEAPDDHTVSLPVRQTHARTGIVDRRHGTSVLLPSVGSPQRATMTSKGLVVDRVIPVRSASLHWALGLVRHSSPPTTIGDADRRPGCGRARPLVGGVSRREPHPQAAGIVAYEPPAQGIPLAGRPVEIRAGARGEPAAEPNAATATSARGRSVHVRRDCVCELQSSLNPMRSRCRLRWCSGAAPGTSVCRTPSWSRSSLGSPSSSRSRTCRRRAVSLSTT
jgi:hypothetical protein